MSKFVLGNDLYIRGRIGWRGLSKDEYLEKSEYKIINATALMDGYVDWDNCGYISKERYEESDEIMLQENDILISKDGTLGKIGYVKNLTTPCTVASGIFVVRNTIPEILDFDYLYHILKSNIFKDFIRRNKAEGSTINHLYQRDLVNFEIDLPEINMQKKIAKVLNDLDNKIENNNKINAELESMAKLIYDYWFVQFDFPDENGRPYKSSGGKMVWNEELKREIPEGWEVRNFVDISTITTGKKDANFASAKGEYKFFTCSKEVLYCNQAEFKGSAILIAGNGDFNVKHYTGEFNAYQRTYVITPKDMNMYGYLYYVSTERVSRFRNDSTGSIVKFITKGDIETIPSLIGKSNSLYEPFSKILLSVEHYQKENQQLASLRDFLLPLFMNGQVTIGEKAGEIKEEN